MSTIATLVSHVTETTTTSTGSPVAGIFGGILGYLVAGAVLWGTFSKSGEPPWAGFVPFYGTYCLTRVAGYNPWMFLLLLIPIVNIVFSIMVALGVGKAFGKGGAFSFFLLWLLSLIGFLIIGYGSAQYVGAGGRREGVYA